MTVTEIVRQVGGVVGGLTIEDAAELVHVAHLAEGRETDDPQV